MTQNSKEIDANPFAFPRPGTTYVAGEAGMTLRDWFAGKAMAEGMNWVNTHQSGGYAQAAAVAYEFADAMLAARAAQS